MWNLRQLNRLPCVPWRRAFSLVEVLMVIGLITVFIGVWSNPDGPVKRPRLPRLVGSELVLWRVAGNPSRVV